MTSTYDRIARFYDVDMAQNMRFDDAAYYAHQCARQRGRVLEVGCGNGRILLPLLRAGHDAFGIDASGPMLRELARKSASARVPARAAQADARSLPFAPGTFATVLCPYSLVTYLASDADLAAFLHEVRNALVPGGLVVVDAFVPRPVEAQHAFTPDYRRPFGAFTLARAKRITPLPDGTNRIERRYEIVSGDGHVVETLEVAEIIRPRACRRPARSAPRRGFREDRRSVGLRHAPAPGRRAVRNALGPQAVTCAPIDAADPASSAPMRPATSPRNDATLPAGLGRPGWRSADDNKVARRWQHRLHWVMVVVALMSVPAYLLSTSELDPVWHEVASVLDYVILAAFVAELVLDDEGVELPDALPARELAQRRDHRWRRRGGARRSHRVDRDRARDARRGRGAGHRANRGRVPRPVHTNRRADAPRHRRAVDDRAGRALLLARSRIRTFADGLWLAFITGATVGYGDVVPTTGTTRLLAVLTVLVGVAMMTRSLRTSSTFFVGGEETRVREALQRDIVVLRGEMSRAARRRGAAAHARAPHEIRELRRRSRCCAAIFARCDLLTMEPRR